MALPHPGPFSGSSRQPQHAESSATVQGIRRPDGANTVPKPSDVSSRRCLRRRPNVSSGALSDLDARNFEVRLTTNEQTFVSSAAGSQKCMGILNNRQRKAARRRLSNSILMIADQTAIDPGLNLRRSDAQRQNGYFNEVLLELNMVFRLLPSPSTTATIASAIPAAISPYSIAVAPDSSDMNFKRL